VGQAKVQQRWAGEGVTKIGGFRDAGGKLEKTKSTISLHRTVYPS